MKYHHIIGCHLRHLQKNNNQSGSSLLKLRPYRIFLRNRKQRLVFRGSSYCWYNVNKGTTQGSVSGPYLFNLFIDDLDLVNCPEASLSEYADDTTMQVVVNKAENDCASDTLAGQVQTVCLVIYPSVKN